MTDTEIKDTKTFQAVLAAADHRDDVEAFLDSHGDDKLAEALVLTIDYLNAN